MIIRFNGVRGSIPKGLGPKERRNLLHKAITFYSESREKDINQFLDKLNQYEYYGFGSETTNISIEDDKEEEIILIDCGTGISNIIPKIFSKYSQGAEINILITHFHWDHLMGLNFFTPIYVPGKVINFYSPDENLETCIRAMFQRPHFPVSFEDLGAEVNFYTVKPRNKYKISGFDVAFYRLDHPDPCWGPRIERNGKAYAHAIDTEATRVTKKELGEDYNLYQSADVLHFDAPYLESEVRGDKKGWGHSSVSRGLNLAKNFSIKNISFGHYTQEVDFKKFSIIKESSQNELDKLKLQGKIDLTVTYSYEGMVLKI